MKKAIEQKADLEDVQESLNSKANKQSVANALHRKANRAEIDAILSTKAESVSHTPNSLRTTCSEFSKLWMLR